MSSSIIVFKSENYTLKKIMEENIFKQLSNYMTMVRERQRQKGKKRIYNKR